MKLDELTQPGWDDIRGYFRQIVKQYGILEIRVPAVLQPKTDDDAVSPAPTLFEGFTQCHDIVPRISQMPEGTSGPRTVHIWLGSGKPQLNLSISGQVPAARSNS